MKKKIAYVTNNIAPFRVALLDTLAEEADVTLYYVRSLDKGVNPLYVSKRPQEARLQSIVQLGLKKTMEQLAQADAVVFDGYTGKYKWLLLIGCIRRNIPYVISVDGILQKTSTGLKTWMKRFALKHARFVFSNDKRTDELLTNLVPGMILKRHRFTTMHASEVDEGFKQRQKHLQLPSFKQEAPILFVGRFVEEKGVEEFVDATLSLCRKKIMIGGTVELLNQLGIAIDNSYTVIPYATQVEIYQYMQAAAVFVLPTHDDPWGLVIVEALSQGVPVVTTTMCNAGVELIQEGKNGFLVPKGDEVTLQKKIKEAMELSPNEVLAVNQQQMQHYTLETAAQNMLQSLIEEER